MPTFWFLYSVTLGMHLCSVCNRRTTDALDEDDDDHHHHRKHFSVA